MGLFDKFKKKPKPCTESEMKYLLFKVGKDWEFYKYDPVCGVAMFWNDTAGNGRDEDCDVYKDEDVPFDDWPFVNNASTEVLSAKDAFPYLI